MSQQITFEKQRCTMYNSTSLYINIERKSRISMLHMCQHVCTVAQGKEDMHKTTQYNNNARKKKNTKPYKSYLQALLPMLLPSSLPTLSSRLFINLFFSTTLCRTGFLVTIYYKKQTLQQRI